MMTKSYYREKAKSMRSGLSEHETQDMSERLCKHLIIWFKNSELVKPETRVFLYSALRGEPDLRLFCQSLSKMKFALPRVLGKTAMEFRSYEANDDLISGPLGIREPSRHAKVLVPGQGDIVLVPALALSKCGQRIGHGAGYYDRYLGGLSAPVTLIGICFSNGLFPIGTWQDEVHDIKVQWIATEEKIAAVET